MRSARRLVSLRAIRSPLALAFSSSGAIVVLNGFTGILLARVLGPEGRGELAAVLLWPAVLAALGSLGVHEGAVVQTARGETRLGAITGSSLAIALAQSALLIGIGAAILPFALADYDRETLVVAYAALVYVPIYLLNMVAMSILNGLHRHGPFQALRLALFLTIASLFTALALVDELGVALAAASYIGAHVLATAVAAALVVRAGAFPLAVDRGVARDMLAFGLRSHVSSTSSLLNDRLDQLLISIFLGPVKLGLYVVALTLASMSAFVGNSAAMVGLPRIAQLRDPDEQAAAAATLVGVTVVASLAVTLPLLVLAPTLIGAFFGGDFSGAAASSRILLVAAVFFALRRTLGAILKGIGRPLQAGAAELVALGITAIALAALLPAFGIVGAAVASLIAYVVAAAWLARSAARALGLPLTRVLLPARVSTT